MALLDDQLGLMSKNLIRRCVALNHRLNALSARSVDAQARAVHLHACLDCVPPEQECKGRVLIVDDNSDTCEILSIVLVAEGYSVRSTPDKESALDAIQERPVSTILMDYYTPGLGSEAFVRKIKVAHPDVCMILMSRMPELTILAESLQLQLFVAKPVNFDRLVKTMAKAAC